VVEQTLHRRIFLPALGLTLVAAGAALVSAGAQLEAAQAQEQRGFATIDSAQLAVMLEKKDFFLVNVHIPYEGEIKDTDALIPFDKIVDNLDKLPKDKSAQIVLYCRSGRMSEIAARELVRLGYTRVSHLAGGMNGWKSSGYQIIEK
jgi:rhodanese-related sulfurtransferase